MNIELITWNDAWENTDEQSISPRNLKKLAQGMKTTTVGWIVSDTEEGVLMVAERWPTKPGHAKYITFIPTGMILSRQVLSPSPDQPVSASLLPQ